MRDWKSRKARTEWDKGMSNQVKTNECFKRVAIEDIGRLGRQDWDPVRGLSMPLSRWQRAVEDFLVSDIIFFFVQNRILLVPLNKMCIQFGP